MSSNAPGFRPEVTTAGPLTERLAAYLPAVLLPNPASANSSFEGVVLAVEVEGFTALAESLVKLGREGAEALGRSLNHYFTPLIEAINRDGGQVISLDGSGLQAFFPASAPDQLSCTARVALGLLDIAAGFHPVQTAEGRYSLGMRAGISQGKLDIIQVGTAVDGKALVLMGAAVDQAQQAAQQAAWGEAVGWPGGPLKPVGQNESSGQPANPDLTFYFGDEDQVSIYNRLAPYLPRVLAQKLKLNPDAPLPVEFRRVVNVFIILPDLDLTREASLAVLQDYYGTLQRVCSGLDGRVHQITADSTGKSVSLHLTFGALISNSDDAENALRAALAVRDLAGSSGALPAISIASGNVFTGSIGTASCQRYTVLGEAVKISRQLAQAAQESSPGVLPVDRYTRERVGLSYIFGDDLSVKLPDQPYPVRTNPLLARRPQPCSLSFYLKEEEAAFTNPPGISASPEELLAGKERVFVRSDAAGFYPLAQDWLKSGGKGAVGTCQSNAASAIPYLAWSGLLGGLIGFNETDSRTEKAAKLSQVVSRFIPEYARYSGWLGQLIGLAPEETGFRAKLAGPQREQFTAIIVELLHGLALANPLLIILNNLQWSDEPGLYLLEQVVRELAAEPVLFGLNVRPGNPAIDSRLAALAG
jgi:class 3 adenylate cyclase